MICLTENEIEHFRDTLALLLAIHSTVRRPEHAAAALEILKANGATDANSAQVVIIGRVLKMAEKFL